MREDGGDYITVTTKRGDDFAVSMGALEQLEEAFLAFHHQPTPPPGGYFIDKVLSIPLEYGQDLTIPVSEIAYFAPSTAAAREKHMLLDMAVRKQRARLDPEGG